MKKAPAPDLSTDEGLVAFMEEAVADIHAALSGRLFYEYDSRNGELRLWRRKRAGRRYAGGRALCGALTRAGTPCRMARVAGRKRCRLHGGLSTGPRTAEGRAAIAESNRRRALKKVDESSGRITCGASARL